MTKVVMITGVSAGVGNSIAKEFIKNKWTVIGCDKDDQNNDIGCDFTKLNITDEKGVKTWIDASIEKHGIPDILINNAGILPKAGPFDIMDVNGFKDVINNNVYGNLYIWKYIIPLMKKSDKKDIKIINISSIGGIAPSAMLSAYSMGKYAMEGLVKAIAGELMMTKCDNIMICSLNPGICGTPGLQSMMGCPPDIAVQKGAIEQSKWGELNYDLIANKINKTEHNGKHVFGNQAKESIYKMVPDPNAHALVKNYKD